MDENNIESPNFTKKVKKTVKFYKDDEIFQDKQEIDTNSILDTDVNENIYNENKYNENKYFENLSTNFDEIKNVKNNVKIISDDDILDDINLDSIKNWLAPIPSQFNWRYVLKMVTDRKMHSKSEVIEFWKNNVYYNSEHYKNYYRYLFKVPLILKENLYLQHLKSSNCSINFENEPYENLYQFYFNIGHESFPLNDNYFRLYYQIPTYFNADIYRKYYNHLKLSPVTKEIFQYYYEIGHQNNPLDERYYRLFFNIPVQFDIELYIKRYELDIKNSDFINLFLYFSKNKIDEPLDEKYYRMFFNIPDYFDVESYLKRYNILSLVANKNDNQIFENYEIFKFYYEHSDYPLDEEYFKIYYKCNDDFEYKLYYEVNKDQIKKNDLNSIFEHFTKNKSNHLYLENYYKNILNLDDNFSLNEYLLMNDCFFKKNSISFKTLISKNPTLVFAFYKEDISLEDLFHLYKNIACDFVKHFVSRYLFLNKQNIKLTEKEKRFYFMIHDFKNDICNENNYTEIYKHQISTQIIKKQETHIEIKEIQKTRRVIVKKKKKVNNSNNAMKLLAMMGAMKGNSNSFDKAAMNSMATNMMLANTGEVKYKEFEDVIDEPYTDYQEEEVVKDVLVKEPVYKDMYYKYNILKYETKDEEFLDYIKQNSFASYFLYRVKNFYNEDSIPVNYNSKKTCVIFICENTDLNEIFIKHCLHTFKTTCKYTILSTSNVFPELCYKAEKYNIQMIEVQNNQMTFDAHNTMLYDHKIIEKIQGEELLFCEPNILFLENFLHKPIQGYQGFMLPKITNLTQGGGNDLFVINKNFYLNSIKNKENLILKSHNNSKLNKQLFFKMPSFELYFTENNCKIESVIDNCFIMNHYQKKESLLKIFQTFAQDINKDLNQINNNFSLVELFRKLKINI